MEESNNKKQGSDSKKKRSFKPTLKQLIAIIIVLAVLLLVTTGIIIYKKGESNGRKAAQRSRFDFGTSLADKLKSGSKTSPIKTVSGTVVSATANEITIEQHNKNHQTLRIDGETRVTLKGEDKKITDVNSGARVTAFARTGSTEEKPLVTRIVIRQEE